MLFVYLNLLLSSYRNKDNLANRQLSNHHLNQLQFFECYHMVLDHFLLADQKRFVVQS